MNRSLLVLACSWLVMLSLFSGCSSGGGAVAPVSGRVTLDGQPLAGAHVSFQPEGGGSLSDSSAGSGSYAVTASDGSYVLRLAVGDRPGAAVGKHRVEISMRNDSDDDTDRHTQPPKQTKVIPPRYNLHTELSCDVPPSGKSDANFDLKSK
jgi:hypothetical protein